MGVDAKIYLPGNVRLSTVCDVISRLLDAPVVKKKLRDDKDDNAWYAHTPEGVVEFNNSIVQGLAGVTINHIDPSLRGYESFQFSYHYEFGGYKNMGACRGMILRSYSANIAILRGLADFFGGKIDYQDCDDVDFDYKIKDKSDDMNCPEDGEAWQNLQERIMAVYPLTQTDIDYCERFAAYKEDQKERQKRLGMKRKTPVEQAVEKLAEQLGQPADIVANILKKGGVM